MTPPSETRRRVLLVLYAILVVVGIPALVDGMPDWRAKPLTWSDLLRYTSANVAPGAEGVADADRVRRIVGDRPIVVLVAPRSGCAGVGAELPGVIVLAVHDDPERPLIPCSSGTSGYDEGALVLEARDTAAREPVAQVEAFVRAFDAATGEPPPRRDPPPAAGPGGLAPGEMKYLIGLGVYLGVLVVFSGYLIRNVWLDKRVPVVREQSWRARTNARLNRLADLLLRTDEPSRPAKTAAAKRYVLILRDFEAAATDEERAAVDRQLLKLERAAGISKKKG